MHKRPIQVLIVDDEASLRVPLAKWLEEEHGYMVEATADGTEALELLAAKGWFDVVLLDYLLPAPYNGLTLMQEIKNRSVDAPAFIIFTGWGLEPHVGVEALKAGAYRYLAKPFDREELSILIESIVEMRRLKRTAREKLWLESLLEVSKSVNSSLELDEVLNLILDELKRVVIYDSATVQRLTAQGLKIVAVRGFPDPDQLVGNVFSFSDKYPNYQVWKSKQPLIVDDMQTAYGTRRLYGWMGVPLIYHDRAIGVITLDSKTPGFYNQDDAQVVMTFANQAAIAVENAHLHQQTRERADALHRLLEIGQQITRVSERPKQVLELIARMACQVTGADCAVIYPYLADKRIYDKVNIASFGLRQPFHPTDKLREYGKSVAARIITEPDGRCIVPNVAQDTEWGSGDKPLRESPFIVREDIQALAGIRLDFGAEPVGVLFVNFRSPHHFGGDKLEIIQLFANQAAVAIWNARLYGRTSEKLERKVAELRIVNEIDKLITSTHDLDEVLRLILDKAMELLSVQNGSLQLIDDSTRELVIQLRRGTTLVPSERVRLRLGEGISGKAAAERQSIIADDVTQSQWQGVYCQFWPDTRSELAVPLMIGDECIGVLNLEHPEVGYFTQDQCEIIEELAAQAAIAIQNAKHYEALVEAQEQLIATEALAWMGMTGSSWAHSVAQKTSSIRNYLAVLKSYLPGDDKPRDILAKADQVAVAIQNIPITRELPTETGLGQVDPVPVDLVLTEEVERYAHSCPDVELEFRLSCPGVKVSMDRGWLSVAMEKLVNNALRAMPGRGCLRIISVLKGTQVEIELIDSGPGIPEPYRPYFLKGRVPKEDQEEGTGMGAFMARTIFRRYGGNVELLWSEPGRGTALRITLPVSEDAKEKNA
jgi:GAF domain-containing protein/ActR/RegA family two-component response regulator